MPSHSHTATQTPVNRRPSSSQRIPGMCPVVSTQRRSGIPIPRSSNTNTQLVESTPSRPIGNPVRERHPGQTLASFTGLKRADVSHSIFVNLNTSGPVSIHNEGASSGQALDNQGNVAVETDSNVQPAHDDSSNIPTPGPSQNADHDIYRKYMCKGRGTPLYLPGPDMALPIEYRKNGVSIGDVGILLRTGDFVFLFNIFLPGDHEINEGRVPNGFKPLDRSKVEKTIKKRVDFDRGSCLASSSLLRTSCDFAFETAGSEGALLVMPDGALSEDLLNYRLIEKYIAKNAKSWYEYVESDDCGMPTENGDIRVVVGMDKVTSWGMATFQNPNVKEPLRFEFKDDGSGSQPRTYKWDRIIGGRTGPPEEETRDLLQGPNASSLRNQCVFVRTLNISVAGKVRDELAVYEVLPSCFRNRVPDSPFGRRNVNPSTPQTSPHPSNLINKYLLEKCPNAEVVITKDSDWISVITEHDAITLSFEEICERVLASHVICEKKGVVTLKRKNIFITGTTSDPTAITIAHQQTNSEALLGNEKGAYTIGRLFLETPDDRPLTDPPGTLGNMFQSLPDVTRRTEPLSTDSCQNASGHPSADVSTSPHTSGSTVLPDKESTASPQGSEQLRPPVLPTFPVLQPSMDHLLCLNILLDDKPFDFYSPGAYFPLTGPNDWNLTTPLMDPPANYPLLDLNEATPLSMTDYFENPESNQLPPGQQRLEKSVANTLLDDTPFDFYPPNDYFPLAGPNDWNLTSAHADPLAGFPYSDPKATLLMDYFKNSKSNQLPQQQLKKRVPSIRLTKASEYKRRDPATFAAPAAFTPHLIKIPVLDDDRQITTSAPAISRLPSLHHKQDIRRVPLNIVTTRYAPTVEYSRDEPFPAKMLEPLESVWERYKAEWLRLVGNSLNIQMSSTSSPGSSAEVTTSTRTSASAPHDRSISQRGFEIYPPFVTRPQRYASTHLALLPTSSGSRRGLFSMPQEQPLLQEPFWNHIIDQNPSFMTTSDDFISGESSCIPSIDDVNSEMDTDVSMDERITDVSQDYDASYSF